MRSQNLFFAIAPFGACATDPEPAPEPAPAPDVIAPSAGVADVPTAAVCGGGRWRCFARIRTAADGGNMIFFAGSGVGPSQIQDAYALDQSGGSDMVIGIVDAYHYAAAAS